MGCVKACCCPNQLSVAASDGGIPSPFNPCMAAGGRWLLGVCLGFAVVGAPKRPSSRRRCRRWLRRRRGRRRRNNSNTKMMVKIRTVRISAMTTLAVWRRMKRLLIGRIRMRLKRMRKIRDGGDKDEHHFHYSVISVPKTHQKLTFRNSMLNPF